MVVANQKGGVGKTTTTVNMAAALAQHGLRVLVVDLDPQGNASTALSVDHHRGTPSTYDAVVEGQPLTEIVQPSPEIEGLFVVPATIDLAGAEIELVSLVARENRLRRALHAHPWVFGTDEDRFDYVLIDCPPSLGLLTLNALVAGDEMLIPIQAEYYALEGLGQLLETVEMVKAHLNPDLAVSTIVLTMYDARTRLSAGVAEEVRTHFGPQVLRTAIPRSVRISEAPELRPDGDDLRSGLPGSAQLPGGRQGDGAPGDRVPTGPAARCRRRSTRMTQKPQQRRGLGRGLGSLIPTAPRPEEGTGTRPPSRRTAQTASPGAPRAADWIGAPGSAADDERAEGSSPGTTDTRTDGRRDHGRRRAATGGGRLLRRAAGDVDRAEPPPAASGVRRGRDGRAGALRARDRAAAADRRPVRRGGPLRADHG